jgi:hypothetical protein
VAFALAALFGGKGLTPLHAFLASDSVPASSVVARPISATEIELSWNPSGPDNGYMIVRSTNHGAHVYEPFSLRSDGDKRLVYVDHLLQPGTTYSYYIVNNPDSYAYYSNESEEVAATTPTFAEGDIGAVAVSGTSSRMGDRYTVGGSGADIWGHADAFHYVYQPWSGDGTMVVRVTGMDNTAQWAKAGIMFRESLAPGARHAMAAMNPKGDSAILSRGTTDGDSQLGISVYTYTPTWLKLVRTGSHFEAFQSRDGSEWISIGAVDVDLPANVYAGLAVGSHNDGTLCRATFDNFNLSSTWNPTGPNGPPTNVQATALNSGQVQVKGTAPTVDGVSYVVERSDDGIFFEYANPDGAGVVHALTAGGTYFFRMRTVRNELAFYSDVVAATTPPAPAEEVPAAPSNLAITTAGSNYFTVSWQDNATNEDEYFLDTSTDGQTWSRAHEVLRNSTSAYLTNLVGGTTYTVRIRAMRTGSTATGNAQIFSAAATIQAKTAGLPPTLTPTGGPTITQQPQNQVVDQTAPGQPAQFTVAAASNAPTYQWRHDGVDAGTRSTLSLTNTYLGDLGLYTAWVADAGGTSMSKPAVLGFTINQKCLPGKEIGRDIHHPNGNIYDQVAMDETPAISLTADPGQVTRTSFLDLDGDIVQVEFSGAGTLSVGFSDRSYERQLAKKYFQPGVDYWSGRAGIVITGADETTNMSVFSVGRATAVNQSLFIDGTDYDGVADIAYIAIVSKNGNFGGVFTGNIRFSATKGQTGLYAPGVTFNGPVTIGDLHAADYAMPVLILGSAATTRVAGGNLAQPNGAAVAISGITQLRFVDGADSHARALPAQTNQARFEQDGRDVTATVVANPQ